MWILSPLLGVAQTSAGLDSVVFDRHAFAQHLPKTVVCFQTVPTDPDESAFLSAIERLKSEDGKTCVSFPKHEQPPRVTHRVTPARPKHVSHADTGLMMLVNATGDVTAVLIVAAADREWAVQCASAAGGWKFAPAKVHGNPVPFVTCLPMRVRTPTGPQSPGHQLPGS